MYFFNAPKIVMTYKVQLHNKNMLDLSSFSICPQLQWEELLNGMAHISYSCLSCET